MTLRKCPECGIWVSNLRKHKKRNRCRRQHLRDEFRRASMPSKNGSRRY